MRIRITKTPPGFADEDIRKAWVGVEMRAEPDKGDTCWSGDENAGGFVVVGIDAVKALPAPAHPPGCSCRVGRSTCYRLTGQSAELQWRSSPEDRPFSYTKYLELRGRFTNSKEKKVSRRVTD